MVEHNPFYNMHNLSTPLYSTVTNRLPFTSNQFALPSTVGYGSMRLYNATNKFAVGVYSFRLHQDVTFTIPAHASLAAMAFSSISGNITNPYRRLVPNNTICMVGSSEPTTVTLHKDIPVQAVSVEWSVEYANRVLADLHLEESTCEPEGVSLLKSDSAVPSVYSTFRHFSQVKACEFVSQAALRIQDVVTTNNTNHANITDALMDVTDEFLHVLQVATPPLPPPISEIDRLMISKVTDYIQVEFAHDVSLHTLAKIACMGTTKLQTTFKAIHHCTIGEYVTNRRLGEAERLLLHTDWNVRTIAQAVGYSNAGRFASTFRNATGFLPNKFRNASSLV